MGQNGIKGCLCRDRSPRFPQNGNDYFLTTNATRLWHHLHFIRYLNRRAVLHGKSVPFSPIWSLSFSRLFRCCNVPPFLSVHLLVYYQCHNTHTHTLCYSLYCFENDEIKKIIFGGVHFLERTFSDVNWEKELHWFRHTSTPWKQQGSGAQLSCRKQQTQSNETRWKWFRGFLLNSRVTNRTCLNIIRFFYYQFLCCCFFFVLFFVDKKETKNSSGGRGRIFRNLVNLLTITPNFHG